MFAALKREVRDWLILAGIAVGSLIILGLVLGGIAFEILKAWALVKFIFWM